MSDNPVKILKAILRRHRIRFLFGFMIAYAGMAIIVLPNRGLENIYSQLTELLAESGVIAVGALLFALGISIIFPLMYKEIFRSTSTEQEIVDDDIERKTSSIQEELRKSEDEERLKQLSAEIDRLQNDLEKSYRENLRDENGKIIPDWREVLMMTRRRLMSEKARLGRRSRVNLTWGIIGSLTALFLVGYFVLRPYPAEHYDLVTQSWLSYSAFFTPKLALVITLQLLAGFFLRNFLITENEIQRNKNEITNSKKEKSSVKDNPLIFDKVGSIIKAAKP